MADDQRVGRVDDLGTGEDDGAGGTGTGEEGGDYAAWSIGVDQPPTDAGTKETCSHLILSRCAEGNAGSSTSSGLRVWGVLRSHIGDFRMERPPAVGTGEWLPGSRGEQAAAGMCGSTAQKGAGKEEATNRWKQAQDGDAGGLSKANPRVWRKLTAGRSKHRQRCKSAAQQRAGEKQAGGRHLDSPAQTQERCPAEGRRGEGWWQIHGFTSTDTQEHCPAEGRRGEGWSQEHGDTSRDAGGLPSRGQEKRRLVTGRGGHHWDVDGGCRIANRAEAVSCRSWNILALEIGQIGIWSWTLPQGRNWMFGEL